MIIRRFETYYWQSNMYLLIDKDRCVIIDPCELKEAEALLVKNNIMPDYALLTHEHCDHITGVDWARNHGSKIICSAVCAGKIKDSRLNAAYYYNDSSQVQKKLKGTEVPIPEDFTCYADIYFEKSLVIEWQGHSIKLVETPGHSSGSICILFDEDTLFAGDTLLEDEPTNTRFPSGSKKLFYDITFPWIKTLNKDTKVYPGHFREFYLMDRLKKDFP